ncbi:hypothetical protein POTOM_031274 [Populus tomentosa]|uniref:Uncharacterized protein n=1 Tax=Populus tomentosa TaxID=118781 RepID=A0A8X7Z7F6_POPTO|nr:hypothetical protein POTOM_031274 [Populus tomentosa]
MAALPVPVFLIWIYTFRGYNNICWCHEEAFGRVGSVSVQGCVMITNPGCLVIYLIIIELIIQFPFLPGDVPSGNVHDGSMPLEMSMMDECTSSLLEDRGENSVAMLKFPENMEFNEGSHTDSSVKESD